MTNGFQTIEAEPNSKFVRLSKKVQDFEHFFLQFSEFFHRSKNSSPLNPRLVCFAFDAKNTTQCKCLFTVNVTIFVSGTIYLFDTMCKRCHRNQLNPFSYGTKNGDIDGTCKRSLNEIKCWVWTANNVWRWSRCRRNVNVTYIAVCIYLFAFE